MIKAIIFDCFGVLVRDGWIPFREGHFGHDDALMQEAIMSNRRVDAGLDSYEDFIHHVAVMAGIQDAEARAEIETNPRNDQLLELIAMLKPNYKIGMLSNAAENWIGEMFTPDQAALFDEIILSCDIGVIKPDPIAYQTAADRLGVAVEECLLVDDQPHYCEGAVAVGMQAIHYEDNLQLAGMFKKHNIFSEKA